MTAKPLWLTLLVSMLSDAAAVAVAFGAPLSGGQQTAILAFVGSAGAFGSVLVALLHAHTISSAVKIQQPPAPPA